MRAQRSMRRNKERISGSRGTTIISLHTHAKSCNVRSQRHTHAKHYFLKNFPCTVVSNKYSTYKIFKKWLKNNGDTVGQREQFVFSCKRSLVNVNNKLKDYNQEYGPTHSTITLNDDWEGIDFTKHMIFETNGNIRILIRYTDKCHILCPEIVPGSIFIDKVVNNLNQARCEVVRGVLYLNAIENGIP